MVLPNTGTPPTVVDIHKVKGVRPEFDVYIGRKGAYPRVRVDFPEDSKWANHFYEDLDAYENHVINDLWDDLDELEGKRLGCWCITTDKVEPLICHGQVLMKLYAVRKEVNDTKRQWGIKP